MEYREGRCPNCNEVMQIPVGRDQIICMFCGRQFSPEESMEKAGAAFEAALESLRQGADSFFVDVEKTVKGFQRHYYEENFQAYLAAQQENLKAIRSVADTAVSREQAAEEVAEIITGSAVKVMDARKGRVGKESMQMSLNMYMVTFLLPAVLADGNGKYSDITDAICRKWSGTFKNSKIQAADFDTLKGGFKKKLCYITTAVCEGLHKPEDCYELNLLKSYRDNCLPGLEEGEELITQYYDMAPTIVKRIKKRKDWEDVCRSLYETYISPCIRLIEEGRDEECREKYKEMVEMLRAEYM